MIKPITTLAILALAISTFAQTQTIKIRSKGDDVRTVIDSIFEQSGKQYVLETNFHQSLYMNLEGISFQKAIDIIAKVTDMEFEEKQGIWYIHKRPITAPQLFAGIPALTPKTTKPTIKPNAPAKTPIAKPNTTKATTTKPLSKAPAATKPTNTAGQGFTNVAPIEVKPPSINLTGRLTVQLKKMDIRAVFSELGSQAKVDIELDDTVPNYKLDASFYNVTLKFALDKICKAAGLKYSSTPSNTIRISKI